MIGTKKHIIGKQVLDLYTDRKEGAWELQRKLRDYYYDKLLLALEKELDEWQNGDEVIRIDHVEVDLGEISGTDWQEDIADRFRAKLHEELRRALHSVQEKPEGTTEVVSVSRRQNSTDVLFYFLRTGVLPWSTPNCNLPELEKFMLKMAERSTVFRTQLIQQLRSPQTADRFVNQFDPAVVYRIFGLCFLRLPAGLEAGRLGEVLHKNVVQAGKVLYLQGRHEREVIRLLLGQYHLRAQATGNVDDVLAGLIAAIGTVSGRSIDHVVVVLFRDIVLSGKKEKTKEQAQIAEGLQKRVTSIPGLQALRSSQLRKLLKEMPYTDDPGMAIRWLKTAARAITGKQPAKKEKKNTSSRKRSEEREDDFTVSGSRSDEQTINISQKNDGPEKIPGEKGSEPGEAIDEIFVPNAGLVLLWRYIPHYLKHFGHVSDTGFSSEEAQHRSVHLLHYLSTGQTEGPEFETGLSKVLCGLAVEEVLQSGFEITEEEKAEAEALLKVVIDHWGALGSCRADVLRQSFICRSGVLRRDGQGWLLQVESAGIDVLLEKLPWTISMVRLSWMEKPIIVQWN